MKTVWVVFSSHELESIHKTKAGASLRVRSLQEKFVGNGWKGGDFHYMEEVLDD